MTIFTASGGESNPKRLHRVLAQSNAKHYRHFLLSPKTQIAYELLITKAQIMNTHYLGPRSMLGFALLCANLPVVVHELAVKLRGQKNHRHRHPASCADLLFCFPAAVDHRHP